MLERLERLSTKMMEFSSFLDSTENAMISYIDKVISKINEMQESLLKCQKSARPALTEIKGSNIQGGEQEGNNCILLTEDNSKVQSFLSDSPVTYVIRVTSDDLLLLCHFWSSIMTTMIFAFDSVLDCRRIYDPGGLHFC